MMDSLPNATSGGVKSAMASGRRRHREIRDVTVVKTDRRLGKKSVMTNLRFDKAVVVCKAVHRMNRDGMKEEEKKEGQEERDEGGKRGSYYCTCKHGGGAGAEFVQLTCPHLKRAKRCPGVRKTSGTKQTDKRYPCDARGGGGQRR